MTSHEFSTNANQDPNLSYLHELANHAYVLAEAAQMGPLGDLAQIKSAAVSEVTQFEHVNTRIPIDVFATLLQRPNTGEPLSERWKLVQQTQKEIGDAVAKNTEAVLALAVKTGQRRPEGIEEDYSSIIADKAIFVAEGGANKTSVVRRGVAEKAMHAIYGENLTAIQLFQFGSKRRISANLTDAITKEVKDNPEHRTIKALAGEYLPKGDFTEFEANLATALADGYNISFIANQDLVHHNIPSTLQPVYRLDSSIDRAILLTHPDSTRPQLVQIQPTGNGLEGGFTALASFVSLPNRQLVIATNGQYRPKDEAQAWKWARDASFNMVPAVSLGDEPNDVWTYRGEEMTTPARPASAYVNELALYGTQLTELITDEVRTRQVAGSHQVFHTYSLPGSIEVELPDGSREIVEPDGSRWTAYTSYGLAYSGPNDLVGYHPE